MDSQSSKRSGFGKTKKRCKKTTRDQAAPRQPLSGYMRFLNERREKIRAEKPSAKFSEITRLMATEWNSLAADQKKVYLDAADQEREKYMEEMAAYKQTEAYKLFNENKMKKKLKASHSDNDDKGAAGCAEKAFEIPIFTEEFLEYNKAREAELRQLRKSNTDLEQQISILEKHMNNMRGAVGQLQSEVDERSDSNNTIKELQALRSYFAEKLAGVALPGTSEKPTLETIDEYVTKLGRLLQESKNCALFAEVKKCLSDIDLNNL